jgi:alpha-beta hydrolase superfamily lysophospholipase
MTMIATEARDLAITSADGLKLHARYWPLPDPRGMVVLAHGFGEHGGSYEHVVRAIGPAAGVEVLAPDFRGHGRSPGRRGVVGRYDELIGDLIAAFEWAGQHRPDLPRFILGHSNGGQVALRAALDPRGGDRIAGLVVSNPSIKLATRVPGYKLRLGRFLLRHAPHLTLKAPLEVEKLTRDPAMQQEREIDPLSHSRISAPLFFGMVEGGEFLVEHASEIRTPILMVLGGADPVIDPAASEALFDRLGSEDKTLRVYPEMLHEPFNDVGREEVFAEIVGWLDRRLPPASDRSL